MKLVYRQTEETFEAEVVKIEKGEWQKIKRCKQFQFDWAKEENVFKLVKVGEENQEVLGLMSLDDIVEELRIHIHLIESSNDNKGKNKIIEGVAGCLLSFAIREAFLKGYSGFVSLLPKSELIDHYVRKYGFTQYGRQLAIEGREAFALTQKYI